MGWWRVFRPCIFGGGIGVSFWVWTIRTSIFASCVLVSDMYEVQHFVKLIIFCHLWQLLLLLCVFDGFSSSRRCLSRDGIRGLRPGGRLWSIHSVFVTSIRQPVAFEMTQKTAAKKLRNNDHSRSLHIDTSMYITAGYLLLFFIKGLQVRVVLWYHCLSLPCLDFLTLLCALPIFFFSTLLYKWYQVY